MGPNRTPKTPRTPLSSAWLSMMAAEEDDEPFEGNFHCAPTPRGSGGGATGQPTPNGRKRAIPITKSWRSYLTENMSEELAAASGEHAADRRVRFDHSPAVERLSQASSTDLADTGVFDLLKKQFMCAIGNTALTKWEEQIEQKLFAMETPMLRRMLDPEEIPSVDSDETSCTSANLSVASSQSFDDIFTKSTEWTEPTAAVGSKSIDAMSTASSKYKDILKRSKREAKLKRMIGEKMGHPSLQKSAFGVSTTNTPAWKPTTHSIGRMKSVRDDISFTEAQKAAVQASPLLETKSLVTNTSRESGRRRRHREELEKKFKLLESTVNDERNESVVILGEPEDAENGNRPVMRGRSSMSRLEIIERGRSPGARRGRSLGRTPKERETKQTPSSAAWVAVPKVYSADSSEKSHTKNAPLALLPEETTPQVCMRPKLNLLNRKKFGPPSIITTQPVSDAISVPTTASSHASVHFQSTMDRPEYDFGSRRHAYVAFFNRGPLLKASKTMRLYDHAAPPSFPTLDGEVVVKVEVSSITETDCAVRRNTFWGQGTTQPLNLPIVPGTAFVGRILQEDKVGARHGFRKGDRVVSLVRVGSNSRHMCIRHDRLVKVPADIDDPSFVACLPEVYLSAFQALHLDQRQGVRYRQNALANKSILILGGSSKMGRALIELALAGGSRTVYATAKEKTYKLVEEAGGIPLDRDPHHWYSLLAGKMDIVICVDCLDLHKCELKYEHMQTLNSQGKLIIMGKPEHRGERVVDLSVVDQHSAGTNRKLYHYNVFDSWEQDLKQGKRDLAYLLKLLSKSLIAPKIFEKVPLNKVARVQEILDRQQLSGFILCEPWLKFRPDEDRERSNSRAESRISGTTISSASTPSTGWDV